MSNTINDIEVESALYEDFLDSVNQCELNYNDLFYWKCKNGTLMSIFHMDKLHLENCVRLFENGKIKLFDYEMYMQYLLMKNRIIELKINKLTIEE